MDVTINHDKKLVTVWLSNAEKADPVISESLKPIYKKYNDVKYTVCVFKSGSNDLSDCTSALLKYNRKKLAGLEVTKEQAMSICR